MWRAAPAALRDALFAFYFASVSGVADGVDEPDDRVIKRCDPVVVVLDALRADCPA